jgi:hypothetical protein
MFVLVKSTLQNISCEQMVKDLPVPFTHSIPQQSKTYLKITRGESSMYSEPPIELCDSEVISFCQRGHSPSSELAQLSRA